MSDAGGRPPRVLLVCEWFVKYTAGLAAGLVAEGCEVWLVTRDHGLEFGGDPGEMRRFVAAMAPDARHLTIDGRVRDPRRLRDMVRLRRRVAAWKPDFVHLQDSLPHDMRLAVAAGLPRPYALTVHDVVPHPGGRQPDARIRLLRGLLRRQARLVFVHSTRLVDRLASLGVDRRRIVVVPHGIEGLEPLPLPEDPEILFFGNVTPYKGVDLLLEAMPAVWARAPRVRLTIAGAGPLPDRPELADERVTVENRHVPEAALRSLFGRATCVVLPYREASQSGVGSLAARYGRPLVVTAVGGLPDLAEGGGGLAVAPEDPGALAAGLLEVVDDRRRALAMSEATIERAHGALWPAVAERTLAAYRADLS